VIITDAGLKRVLPPRPARGQSASRGMHLDQHDPIAGLDPVDGSAGAPDPRSDDYDRIAFAAHLVPVSIPCDTSQTSNRSLSTQHLHYHNVRECAFDEYAPSKQECACHAGDQAPDRILGCVQELLKRLRKNVLRCPLPILPGSPSTIRLLDGIRFAAPAISASGHHIHW